MNTLLFLDDIRNPFGNIDNDPDKGTWLIFSPIEQPYEVIWVKSYKEFAEWIHNNALPTAICFDHDLGDDIAIKAKERGLTKKKARLLKQQEKNGMDCAKFLVDYCMDNNLKLPLYNIQSANPVGKENIDSLLKQFKKFQEND